MFKNIINQVLHKKKIILITIIAFFIIIFYFIFEMFWNKFNGYGELIDNDENDIMKEENTNVDEIITNSEDNVKNNNDKDYKEENSDSENQENISEKDKQKKEIYIYITGQVNKSGVVILKEGSRISDAIEAAGGITDNADISKMNLVYVLSDGAKLNIPSFKELQDNPNFKYITFDSSEGENFNQDMTNESKETETPENLSKAEKKKKVNINSASQTELELLPRYRSIYCIKNY